MSCAAVSSAVSFSSRDGRFRRVGEKRQHADAAAAKEDAERGAVERGAGAGRAGGAARVLGARESFGTLLQADYDVLSVAPVSECSLAYAMRETPARTASRLRDEPNATAARVYELRTARASCTCGRCWWR